MKLATLIALGATTLFAATALAHDHDNCAQAHGLMQHDGSRMAALHAKYQARLHGKLKLTAEQEPAWKTFTEKTQPDLTRFKAQREEMATLNTPARLDRMLALGKEREARMAEHAAAVKEFYALLQPEQQKIFDDQIKAWESRGRTKRQAHREHHEHHEHHAAPAAPATAK